MSEERQKQGNNNSCGADEVVGAGFAVARPVLRRTQPKVTPPFKAVPKTPAFVKKSTASPRNAENNKSPNSPKLLPLQAVHRNLEIVIPDKHPEEVSSAPSSITPNSLRVDCDDACSIASSSSCSPCFKQSASSPSPRGNTGTLKKKKKKKLITPSKQIPEMMLPPVKKMPSPQEVQAQRKLKISHYGRKLGSPKACKPVVPELDSPNASPTQIKRCAWITPQSDAAYILYHDEEWGVPVHDDKMLFELLVLAGAQSEMGWSEIIRKREAYRTAFSGFDPSAIAAFDKKKVAALRQELDIFQKEGKMQSIVDNAKRVLEIVGEYGSLSAYVWKFVNNKPIVTSCVRASPAKTSKSEVMSKDFVKRGFGCVGPTIVYTFMQAAGLTNDHIITCAFKNKNQQQQHHQQHHHQHQHHHHQNHHQTHLQQLAVHVC